MAYSSTELKDKAFRDSEEQDTLQRAESMGLKYADLRQIVPSDDDMQLIPANDARQYKTIPIAVRNGLFYLGIVSPQISGLAEFVESLKGEHDVVLVLISQSSFVDNIVRYDDFVINKKIELEPGTIILESGEKTDLSSLGSKLQTDGIQFLLADILAAAIQTKSSDIHIEPRSDGANIRFRIDGVLHPIAQLPKDRHNYLLSEVFINSSLQMDAGKPQNGRLHTQSENVNISGVDIRVETIPVLHGQEVVMRLFHNEAQELRLTDLGITKEAYPNIKEILLRPHGMVIVVGPTGSGKTSTLYALLGELNSPERKIVTLEDPVEYELPGISQSQVNQGEIFLDRLKAVLREDPDIIMIGEIRDNDTAKTALQSALTGHLLLTTFHANNAAIAIARLSDMVGDVSLISSSINLIVAQRLVRKICPYCRSEEGLGTDKLAVAKHIFETLPEKYRTHYKNLQFFKGKGCDRCFNIGYKGRIGIYEMLKVTTDMQQLIMTRALPSVIQAAAIKNGMLTMEQDGLLKALAGITTVDEILKTVKE
ncbi:TPA: hypothetical protein DDW69_05030 [candidate division CPR2 bacterium]|uniref:Type II secretion system protein E (GspE) n=1 Tax=candidate division CPR2 bacterium GW2011_GWC1_41_48 TaxID=1618344 RepID=A0A0G0YIM7_UNCC2|nr:MAG: Type II secretion system protein E (GspE) [candidate division CPR2 bacterium GW2011_GWC2_39_35]KKR27695.1 MAG: Type II secretion system protein E (GspE) [candidate division CPR2 bacterium GW2011_GWD2_39_7]KKR28688.1 MAG: Type II secretion system protein E (GspE) [candidate division CPR2 bacterium GW2011_GWD1_39_7]KKS09406.1 MAG: Type II secretion system protein E (GspE) [candidate division CPR2 bacterium GW2011_GWC1_41_48]OGB71769.1 MAG: hypothetical protein A2Y26_05460 [candidate divis